MRNTAGTGWTGRPRKHSDCDRPSFRNMHIQKSTGYISNIETLLQKYSYCISLILHGLTKHSTTSQRIVGSSELIVLINGFCFIHTFSETPGGCDPGLWDPLLGTIGRPLNVCFTSLTLLPAGCFCSGCKNTGFMVPFLFCHLKNSE